MVDDPVHEARLLGQAQELVRIEQATLRMQPAQQGLESHNGAALQAELRLVVQDELPGVETGTELLDGLEPAPGPAVLGRLEHDVGEAGPLRLVHRDIGVLEQR